MFFSTNQESSKNNPQPNPSSPLFLVFEFPLNRASIIHFMLNGCERYGMAYKALPVSNLVLYSCCLMYIKAPLVSEPGAVITSFTRGAIVTH